MAASAFVISLYGLTGQTVDSEVTAVVDSGVSAVVMVEEEMETGTSQVLNDDS